MSLLKQSSTAQPLLFLMVDSTDHITGKTGLSPTVTLSKNGGAFASPAGAVTEIANGWYQVTGHATDTGTLGQLVLHATSAGADPVDDRYEVVAFDPQVAYAVPGDKMDLQNAPNSTAIAAFTTANWAATTAANDDSGSMGEALGAAGTAGDPWLADLSTYTSGQAGHTIYTNINAPIGSVPAATWALDISGYTTADTAGKLLNDSGAAGDPWSTSLPGSYTGTQAGKIIGDNINAAISTRSTYAGADTAGTTTLLTRLPSVLSPAVVNAQVDTALADYDGPTKAEMDAAVGAVAGDVWDEDPADHTADDTFGKMIAAISPAAIADAIWSALTTGITTTGSIGVFILAKLGLITSAGILQADIVSDGDVITTYLGRSKKIEFVIPTASINLADHTAKFGITKRSGTGTDALEIVGTIETVGDDYHLTFNLTTAQTAALALSPIPTHPYRQNTAESYSYTWSISATNGGGSCPQLADGYMLVKSSDTSCTIPE